MVIVKRSEVVLADLGNTTGHEQSKIRPVIIIQENISNMYSTVTIVMPLTSNISERDRPSNVFISPAKNGLKKPSLALSNQIRVIDKRKIIKPLGFISDADMERIDNALKRILGLD